MSKILVKLPVDRNYTGVLQLENDRGRVLAGPFPVCARSNDQAAAEHGNPSRNSLLPYGDTPLGTYKVSHLLSTGEGTSYRMDRYGPHGAAVLLPVDGDAALAEANGRFTCLIHGGVLSEDKQLLATTGCMRLSNRDQKKLMASLRKLDDVICLCVEAFPERGAQLVAVDFDYDEPDPPLLHSVTDSRGIAPTPINYTRREFVKRAGAAAFGLGIGATLWRYATPSAYAQGYGGTGLTLSLSPSSICGGESCEATIQNFNVDLDESVTLFSDPSDAVSFSNNPVDVPGATLDANGNVIPGTAIVTVTAIPASLPSPDVNINATDPSGDSASALLIVNDPTLPRIDSLNPSSEAAGGPDFTLTVNGANFVSNSVVSFNGNQLSTQTGSDTVLTAAVPASLIATPGTASVVVNNPGGCGGDSNSADFTITSQNPVPSIDNLDPSSAAVGGQDFTLAVVGSNFVTGATVKFNGSPLETTFDSDSQLTATVPASAITTASTVPVVVTNPGPGGGDSNSVDFSIQSAGLTISLSPDTICGGDSCVATIQNFNVGQEERVTLTADPLIAVTFSDDSFNVPPATQDANGNVTPGSKHITVMATPISLMSPLVTIAATDSSGDNISTVLIVNEPTLPRIDSLDPSSATPGGQDFTLTVTGGNFVSGSTVMFNGTELSTQFGSDTQLTATVPASLIATAGTVPVVVTNPAPCGGASSPVNFPIGASLILKFADNLVPNGRLTPSVRPRIYVGNKSGYFNLPLSVQIMTFFATVTDNAKNPQPNVTVTFAISSADGDATGSAGHDRNHDSPRPHGWLFQLTTQQFLDKNDPNHVTTIVDPNSNPPIDNTPKYAVATDGLGGDKQTNSIDVVTDQSGQAAFFYITPEISGAELITAVIQAQPSVAQEQLQFEVRIAPDQSGKDLQNLLPTTNLWIIGQTNAHNVNHWTAERMVSALTDLASTYTQYQAGDTGQGGLQQLINQLASIQNIPATKGFSGGRYDFPATDTPQTLRHSPPLFVPQSPEPLLVNDISLNWGGLFDIAGDWSASAGHGGHRFGDNADLKSTHLVTGDPRMSSNAIGDYRFANATDQISKTVYSLVTQIHLARINWLRQALQDIIVGNYGGSLAREGDHFHIQIPLS